MKYVLGFVFNESLDKIALIRKNRPAWQKGLLNGIGGKIEADELTLDAMTREFEEETSCSIDNYKWFESSHIEFDGGLVYCYATTFHNLDLLHCDESEEIEIHFLDRLQDEKLAPNLLDHLNIALSKLKSN